MSSSPAMSIRFGGRREIGYVRQENQDQVSRFSSPYGEVFLLADGMGGHEGGGIAANMAITGFERHFLSQGAEIALADALGRAANLTNGDIYARGHSAAPNPAAANAAAMGSTLALVVVQKEHFVTAHMGDSRVYLFRGGRLQQLTRDHNVIQRMLDAGLMTQDEVRLHPDASILTRALGQGETMELEVSEPYALVDGDVLMLCSDGLSGYVDDARIEEALRRNDDPQKAADALAELALEAGGFDNISIWVVRANSAPAEPARPASPTPVEQPPMPGSSFSPGSAPAAPMPAPAAARTSGHPGRWVALVLLLLAVGAGGWFAWQDSRARSWIRRQTGFAPPVPAAAARSTRQSANMAPRAPSPSQAPVEVKPAPLLPAGPAALIPGANPPAKGANPPESNGIRVVLVHLPNLDAMGVNTLSTLRERLRAAGFEPSDKAVADPRNEAWRLLPSESRTAQPGKSGVVVAVYLAGFEEQAGFACKVLECTSTHAVDASHLPIFKGNFEGRQIAVFTLDPATAAALPEK